MIKELSKISFLLFLSTTLVMTSCDDDDDEPPTTTVPTQNIVEIAQENERFSILVEALLVTDLDIILEGDGPYTVFAPNNDAFNAYFDAQNYSDDNANGSRLDEVVADIGEDGVEDLLLYHVIATEISASDINEQMYVFTSSNESPQDDPLSLLAEPVNNTVWVNGGSGKGAMVIAADIFATNGVIHEVDGVLGLPSVVDHVIFNSNLSELEDAVIDTDLSDPFNNASLITLFAPTNEAFNEIETTIEGLTTEQLKDVLQYHVLPVQIRIGQMASGPQNTLENEEIIIDISVLDESITVTDVLGEVHNVSAVNNIQGTNGVVHLVDGVLTPTL